MHAYVQYACDGLPISLKTCHQETRLLKSGCTVFPPNHDCLTPKTIILLGVKRNKMLNIKTKFGTFQILGKEEFSKQAKGRFTQSNFLIQLFFSPLFMTTIGYVNANL